jgi:phage terminase large subunit-like protein
MVEQTIRSVPGGKSVNFKTVRASRGKQTRAEPISALWNPPKQIDMEPRAHMVGKFEQLEEELCGWVPGRGDSPNRLDAMVWAYTELDIPAGGWYTW